MRLLRRAGLWVVLAACSCGASAWGNPYLDEAQRHYEALRFADALEQLRIARQVPTNDMDEKLRILDLLGRCLVAEGQRAEAEAAYSELLTLEPEHELPRNVSPKITEAFDAAKERLYARDFVALKLVPAPVGEARARVVDPWHLVSVVVLRSRADGEEGFAESIAAVERGVAVLPLASLGKRVQWYVEARGEGGRTLATAGSEEEPLRFEAAPDAAISGGGGLPGGRSTGRTAAAWVATGLAVGAVVAGGALQLASQESHAAAVREGEDLAARQLQARAVSEATWSAGLFVAAGAAGVSAAVLWVW